MQRSEYVEAEMKLYYYHRHRPRERGVFLALLSEV